MHLLLPLDDGCSSQKNTRSARTHWLTQFRYSSWQTLSSAAQHPAHTEGEKKGNTFQKKMSLATQKSTKPATKLPTDSRTLHLARSQLELLVCCFFDVISSKHLSHLMPLRMHIPLLLQSCSWACWQDENDFGSSAPSAIGFASAAEQKDCCCPPLHHEDDDDDDDNTAAAPESACSRRSRIRGRNAFIV